MSVGISDRVVALCGQALDRLGPGASSDAVEAVRARLPEPIRVAVAGMVKAGKSTLVNALLHRAVAPTAAGECTRLVTWYRYGFPERAEVLFHSGRTAPVPLTADGRLPEQIGVEPAEVDRLTVWLSVERLRGATIIDTPGLGSANDELSDAARRLLAQDSTGAVAHADALLYVFGRAPGAEDAAALRAFSSAVGGGGSALGTVGVLNRADMLGAARDEGLAEAHAVATRSAAELRTEVSSVIPLVALLAETADVHLCEDDAAALRELAGLDAHVRERLLMSADAVTRLPVSVAFDARRRLVQLLGLFGLERCLAWIDAGAWDVASLAPLLRDLSGIERLEEHLMQTIWHRPDVLKASRALAELDRLAYARTDPGNEVALRWLRDELDSLRVDPDMHALAEVRALHEVACGAVHLPDGLERDLRAVALHAEPFEKLGARLGTEPGQLRSLALAGASRWRTFVNQASTSPAEAAVGTVVCTAYEDLWRRLSENGG